MIQKRNLARKKTVRPEEARLLFIERIRPVIKKKRSMQIHHSQPIPIVNGRDWKSWLEVWGKITAAGIGILYATGLVIQNLFLSSFHIRAVELINAKYIFVGFYFWLFILLLAIVPFLIRKTSLRILYIFIVIVAVLLYDPLVSTYVDEFIDMMKRPPENRHIFAVSSFLSFFQHNLDTLILEIATVVTLFKFGEALFRNLKEKKRNQGHYLLVALIVISLTLGFWEFSNQIFPEIPDAVGGGKLPYVEIVFSQDSPDTLMDKFNIGVRRDGKTFANVYGGRLIYIDNNSAFLEVIQDHEDPTADYGVRSDISFYEINRSYIDLLIYR